MSNEAIRHALDASPSTPMEQYHYLSGKIDGKLEAYGIQSTHHQPAQQEVPQAAEHRQGCEALGGYGNGVGPCTCKQEPQEPGA